MRRILLCALLIVTTYALVIYLQQINTLIRKENIDITKTIQNFVTTHSYVLDALKNNKIKQDEKTVLPHNQEKLKDKPVAKTEVITQKQEIIFNESTCEERVLQYLKKSLYVSDVNSYQSIGRGKIDNKEFFAFHFYKDNMYLISYYIDSDFNIFYKDIFSSELRQAGTENLYRNISLNFDNTAKVDKQNIIDCVNETISTENNKYELIYDGYYNVNNREMVYLHYYNTDDNIMEIYYDCNTKELYYMTEILEPILED